MKCSRSICCSCCRLFQCSCQLLKLRPPSCCIVSLACDTFSETDFHSTLFLACVMSLIPRLVLEVSRIRWRSAALDFFLLLPGCGFSDVEPREAISEIVYSICKNDYRLMCLDGSLSYTKVFLPATLRLLACRVGSMSLLQYMTILIYTI